VAPFLLEKTDVDSDKSDILTKPYFKQTLLRRIDFFPDPWPNINIKPYYESYNFFQIHGLYHIKPCLSSIFKPYIKQIVVCQIKVLGV